MRLFNRLLSLSVAVLVVACALSPQIVSIKPDIDVEVADYGMNRDINVRVQDRRQSPVIGTRGGVYENTSTIEIGNDYQKEIAVTVASALTRWGFRSSVSGYPGHAIEFKVFLDELRYEPDRSVAGKTLIRAKISVLVEDGRHNYNGSYEATREFVYATAPSAAKNAAEINAVLSAALQAMFADADMVNYLL